MKSKSLLREYVTLLAEKIRSKSDFGFKKKFSFQEFKNLNGIYAAFTYANERLEKIGEGSSRDVFAFTNRHVLKVATNTPGIEQNLAELEVATNPSLKNIVAKIRDYNPSGYWVIMELVRPINSSEFEKLSGIDSWSYQEILQINGSSMTPSVPFEEQVKDYSPETQKWLVDVIQVAKSSNLALGDLYPRSWGKTVDGRLVLFDYGLTRDIYRKHYA